MADALPSLEDLLGKTQPDFASWFATIYDVNNQLRQTIKEVLTYTTNSFNEELAKGLPDVQHRVSNIYDESLKLIREPTLTNLVNSLSFNYYCLLTLEQPPINVYNKLVAELEIAAELDQPHASIKSRKRPLDKKELDSLRNNKFAALADKSDEDCDDDENMQTDRDNGGDLDSHESAGKEKTHPFLIEIDKHWTKLAKELEKIVDPPPTISLDGERLKVYTKDITCFRQIQNYLDDKQYKYVTLSPRNQRPRKILLKGIPQFTPQEELIDSFREIGFTATRVAMMKSRKTGQYLPMYVCSILPCENLDTLYDIKRFHHLKVEFVPFNSNGRPSQCYNCLLYGHASEGCKFEPRCVKCAQGHQTKNCPHRGKITPKCANCGQDHVASYGGCPMNPLNRRKNKEKEKTKGKQNSAPAKKPPPPPIDIPDILAAYNYTKLTEDRAVKRTARVPEKKDFPPLNPVTIIEITEETTGGDNATSSTPDEGIKFDSIPSAVADIKNSFSDFKEVIKLTKLLASIQNIAAKTRKYKNPFEKLTCAIQEIEIFVRDLEEAFNDE